jgi:hypothetical protein
MAHGQSEYERGARWDSRTAQQGKPHKCTKEEKKKKRQDEKEDQGPGDGARGSHILDRHEAGGLLALRRRRCRGGVCAGQREISEKIVKMATNEKRKQAGKKTQASSTHTFADERLTLIDNDGARAACHVVSL